MQAKENVMKSRKPSNTARQASEEMEQIMNPTATVIKILLQELNLMLLKFP
jgi:hypothetical protein